MNIFRIIQNLIWLMKFTLELTVPVSNAVKAHNVNKNYFKQFWQQED